MEPKTNPEIRQSVPTTLQGEKQAMRLTSRQDVLLVGVFIVVALIVIAWIARPSSNSSRLLVSSPSVSEGTVIVHVCEPASYYPDNIEMWFQEVSPSATSGYVQDANYTTLAPGSTVAESPPFVVPGNQTCTPAGLSAPSGETVTGRFYFVSEQSGLRSEVVNFTTG